MSVTSLNRLDLKNMIVAGANELNHHKEAVDAMNVFPVPDGDTGTNMSLTVLAAAKEAEKAKETDGVGEVSALAAGGALRGARGNSGVITSQLFRGFSKGLEGMEEAGVKELAAAMEKGVQTAYKAVMKPKEGTILTVARVCAEAAVQAAEETDEIDVFLKRVIAKGHEILLQTPEMLPVLKQAGVVDAGGRGFLYVLEGALKYLNGEEIAAGPVQSVSSANLSEYAALASVENESITFGYCTEFFINVKKPSEETVLGLQEYLATIGDSIVCVSDDEIIKIHVHTDHPGLAIERALAIGSLSGLKIDNMREQHTNRIDFSAAAPKAVQTEKTAQKPAENQAPKKIGFVAISAGDGLAEIFRNLGVDEVIEGGQTMNPSTEDILNAVEKVNAENVMILPNNKNIILAAEQAVELCEDKKLYVIPSRSVPEGISAMFCYEEDAEAQTLCEQMKEAIASVATATVTYAVRDTSFDGKEIKEGDILGMLNDRIVTISKDVLEGTKELLASALTDESEMVSIYFGAEANSEVTDALVAYVEENYPECEVEVQYGGQPLYFYIISVE